MRLGLGLWLGGNGQGGNSSSFWVAAVSDDTPVPNNELPVLVPTGETGVQGQLVTNLFGTVTFDVDPAYASNFDFGATSYTGLPNKARAKCDLDILTSVIQEGVNDPILFIAIGEDAQGNPLEIGMNIIFEGVGTAPVTDSAAAYLLTLGFI